MPDTFVSLVDHPRFVRRSLLEVGRDRRTEAGLEPGLQAFLASVLCACRSGHPRADLHEDVDAAWRAAKQLIELEGV